MKRRDLMKRLRNQAKALGSDFTTKEGGSHTKVTIGPVVLIVPRHSEINEMTAHAILKQAGVQK